MEFEAEEQMQNTQLLNEAQSLPPAAPLTCDLPGPPAPEVCQQPGKATQAQQKLWTTGCTGASQIRDGMALAFVSFPAGAGIWCSKQNTP